MYGILQLIQQLSNNGSILPILHVLVCLLMGVGLAVDVVAQVLDIARKGRA